MEESKLATQVRVMERAAFLTAWREKKLKGLILGVAATQGNAATVLEALAVSGGYYASGSKISCPRRARWGAGSIPGVAGQQRQTARRDTLSASPFPRRTSLPADVQKRPLLSAADAWALGSFTLSEVVYGTGYTIEATGQHQWWIKTGSRNN